VNAVERAARALLRSKRNGPPESYPPGYVDAHVEKYWHLMVDDARVVIESLREPTPEMCTEPDFHDNCAMCGGHLEGYREMIGKALK